MSERSQHDGFFKALMEQPGTAGALLREHLPEPIALALAPGEPELVPGSFVDARLRQLQSDRLYRLKLRSGGPLFVYCLVEHKSAIDPRVAWQLLRYMVRIWERLDRESGRRQKLPPIVPLVVYHGAEQWELPKQFSAMVEASAELQAHLLDFPFEFVDVPRAEEAALSHNPLLQAGLLVLKYAMVNGEGEPGELMATLLLRLQKSGASREFLVQVLRYILGAYARLTRDEVTEALSRVMPGKEGEMLSIAAREIMAESHAKGRAEGRAEGREEGRAEGRAQALLVVLENLFGPVPASYREIIASAGIDELDRWLGQAVKAPSLEALFATRPH